MAMTSGALAIVALHRGKGALSPASTALTIPSLKSGPRLQDIGRGKPMREVEIEPGLAPGVVDAALHLVPFDDERQDGNRRRLLLAGWQAEARDQLLHRLLH